VDLIGSHGLKKGAPGYLSTETARKIRLNARIG
jgi:hypothetical protein